MYINQDDGEGEQGVDKLLVNKDDGSEVGVEAMYVNNVDSEGEQLIYESSSDSPLDRESVEIESYPDSDWDNRWPETSNPNDIAVIEDAAFVGEYGAHFDGFAIKRSQPGDGLENYLYADDEWRVWFYPFATGNSFTFDFRWAINDDMSEYYEASVYFHEDRVIGFDAEDWHFDFYSPKISAGSWYLLEKFNDEAGWGLALYDEDVELLGSDSSTNFKRGYDDGGVRIRNQNVGEGELYVDDWCRYSE